MSQTVALKLFGNALEQMAHASTRIFSPGVAGPSATASNLIRTAVELSSRQLNDADPVLATRLLQHADSVASNAGRVRFQMTGAGNALSDALERMQSDAIRAVQILEP